MKSFKKKHWILSAIVIKLILSTIFVATLPQGHSIQGFFGHWAGDSADYIKSIENLIQKGKYAKDPDDLKTYTRRMPGYGAIYFLPRLFFSQAHALTLLMILQIFISAISVYYLALIAYLIFQKKSIFYITFFLYVFSTYVSIFDSFIVTESLSVSSLIFSFYFALKALNTSAKKYFFLSGLFLSWCIFMKPYLILFFPVFIIIFLSQYILKRPVPSLKPILSNLLIFISVFSILESLWIWRNYKIYNHWVPLAYVDAKRMSIHSKVNSSIFRSDSQEALYDFISSIGGSIEPWNPRSEACWVEGYGSKGPYWHPISYDPPPYNPFPNFIYTSKYDFNSLINIRKNYLMAHDINLPMSEREKYEKITTHMLREYIKSFKEERPIHYYFTAYLRTITLFLFHSGTYNLLPVSFHDGNSIQKIFKITYSLLYLFMIISGLLGIILLLFKKFNITTASLCIMPLYFIVLFGIILRNPTYRFFVPAYPFMVILASYSIVSTIKTLKEKWPQKALAYFRSN